MCKRGSPTWTPDKILNKVAVSLSFWLGYANVTDNGQCEVRQNIMGHGGSVNGLFFAFFLFAVQLYHNGLLDKEWFL